MGVMFEDYLLPRTSDFCLWCVKNAPYGVASLQDDFCFFKKNLLITTFDYNR